MAQTYFFDQISKSQYMIFKDGEKLPVAKTETREDAELIVGALNAAASIYKKILPKATIEDNEGDFCVYDESGHLIYDGFDTYEKAKAHASEDGYEVVELIHTAPIGEEVEGFTDFIPGEWNYKRQGFKITVGNNDTGATKNGHDYTVCIIEDNSFQAEANARLIASAPTLYRENARLKEQVKESKAEITRLKSLIYEFADKIKSV